MNFFQDFLKHFLEVFIDDFAVFSKKDKHLKFLEKTFVKCKETGLKLHLGKCFMGIHFRILLSHIVSSRGLEVDMEKMTN